MHNNYFPAADQKESSRHHDREETQWLEKEFGKELEQALRVDHLKHTKIELMKRRQIEAMRVQAELERKTTQEAPKPRTASPERTTHLKRRELEAMETRFNRIKNQIPERQIQLSPERLSRSQDLRSERIALRKSLMEAKKSAETSPEKKMNLEKMRVGTLLAERIAIRKFEMEDLQKKEMERYFLVFKEESRLVSQKHGFSQVLVDSLERIEEKLSGENGEKFQVSCSKNGRKNRWDKKAELAELVAEVDEFMVEETRAKLNRDALRAEERRLYSEAENSLFLRKSLTRNSFNSLLDEIEDPEVEEIETKKIIVDQLLEIKEGSVFSSGFLERINSRGRC